jgi:hypothetical protein
MEAHRSWFRWRILLSFAVLLLCVSSVAGREVEAGARDDPNLPGPGAVAADIPGLLACVDEGATTMMVVGL